MIRCTICFSFLLFIFGCCRHSKDNNSLQDDKFTKSESTDTLEDNNKFIKIEITDSYLKEILRDYSKLYDSDDYNLKEKGVLMTSIITNQDTTKYYVNLFPTRDFFDYWMVDKNFLLYDTIGGRMVVLATKQESFYRFANIEADPDSILNRYDYKSRPTIIEIWLVEYTRVDSSISKRVYYQNPF